MEIGVGKKLFFFPVVKKAMTNRFAMAHPFTKR